MAINLNVNKVKSEEWSILDEKGQRAFNFTVFVGASFKAESKTTFAPIETGSFVSYSVVNSPQEINVILNKRGEPYDLQLIIDTFLNYAKSNKLLSVITPEKEYKNMHLEKVTFDRNTDDGIDQIYAELSFLEVKQVNNAYTNVRLNKKVGRGRQQPTEKSLLQGVKELLF